MEKNFLLSFVTKLGVKHYLNCIKKNLCLKKNQQIKGKVNGTVITALILSFGTILIICSQNPHDQSYFRNKMITSHNSRKHIAPDKIGVNQRWKALEKNVIGPCWNSQYISHKYLYTLKSLFIDFSTRWQHPNIWLTIHQEALEFRIKEWTVSANHGHSLWIMIEMHKHL